MCLCVLHQSGLPSVLLKVDGGNLGWLTLKHRSLCGEQVPKPLRQVHAVLHLESVQEQAAQQEVSGRGSSGEEGNVRARTAAHMPRQSKRRTRITPRPKPP